MHVHSGVEKKAKHVPQPIIFSGYFYWFISTRRFKKRSKLKKPSNESKNWQENWSMVCSKKIVFYATEQKNLNVRVKCSLCYLGGRSIDGRDSLVHLDGYSVSSYRVFCFFGKLNFIETNHNTKPPGHIPEKWEPSIQTTRPIIRPEMK